MHVIQTSSEGRLATSVPPEPIPVLVICGHPLLCGGIAARIEEHERLELLGHTGDPTLAHELVKAMQPAVVVLDVGMANGDQDTALRIVRRDEIDFEVKIVLVQGRAGYDAAALLVSMDHSRPAESLLPDEDAHYLCEEIVDLACGNPRTLGTLRIAHARVYAERRRGDLTDRELRILILEADGLRDHEIAERLNLKLSTVKKHAERARTKLDARNSKHAIAIALRTGLIE